MFQNAQHFHIAIRWQQGNPTTHLSLFSFSQRKRPTQKKNQKSLNLAHAQRKNDMTIDLLTKKRS